MPTKRQKPQQSTHELLLTVVAVIMSGGFLVLAIVDPAYREPFAQLAQFALAGYLGWMLKTPPSLEP